MGYNILYVLSTSITGVLLFYAGHSVERFLLGFFSFIYSCIFFHVVSYKSIIPTYKRIWHNYKIKFIEINLIMVLVMGSIVYFPIFYSPALQKITSMGICATIGAYVLFYRTKTSINKYRLLSLLLAMGGYYLFALYSYSGLNYILMVLLSVFFSWAIYRNTVLIEYFTRQKFTVTEILAIRSWILLIVSYLFAHHLHQVISFAAICFKIQEISIIVSTISFVLVSYLLQKAIEASGNVKTNIINGVIPLVTFIMQLTLIRHLASIDELVTSILITLIIIGFAVLSSKYKA